MSDQNLLTKTALFVREQQRLNHWGIDGQSRYTSALMDSIAAEMNRRKIEATSETFLAAMISYAQGKQTELANKSADANEAEQKQLFEKYMKYQAIIEKIQGVLNG